MRKVEKEYCDRIKRVLDQSAPAVEKAILVVYRNQTPAETAFGTTIEDNGIGYSGADAEFMSSLAEWILSGKSLSQGQLKYGRKIIKKYSRQLLMEAKRVGKFKEAE